MSTELQSSSKAYDLTRVGMGAGEVGLIVGKRIWGSASVTLTVPDINSMFASGDFSRVQSDLDLLDETMDRLKYDLARFTISKGNGMEAY